jgi:hypothetical protein
MAPFLVLKSFLLASKLSKCNHFAPFLSTNPTICSFVPQDVILPCLAAALNMLGGDIAFSIVIDRTWHCLLTVIFLEKC